MRNSRSNEGIRSLGSEIFSPSYVSFDTRFLLSYSNYEDESMY